MNVQNPELLCRCWRTFCSAACRGGPARPGRASFLAEAVLECQRRGELRAAWHRYIFALPNDTNTISWLSEQIESPSLFVSLCAPVSLFSLVNTHTCTRTHAGSVRPSPIIIHVLPYISMLFNCIWVSSLPLLKPEDMEFVSLLIRQWRGGRV